MKKLAVLISNAGTGSNLQAIIGAIQEGTLHATVAIVISDKTDAQGVERAAKHNIPARICEKKESLASVLREHQPDYLCLAGWRQIIPDTVLRAYSGRIVNIHPGLIPDALDGQVMNPDGTVALWNRGKFTDAAIQNFLDRNATYAGSTVHLLSDEFDFGPVLARTFEKIQPDDTIETLYARLKQKENRIYVEALQTLCNN